MPLESPSLKLTSVPPTTVVPSGAEIVLEEVESGASATVAVLIAVPLLPASLVSVIDTLTVSVPSSA